MKNIDDHAWWNIFNVKNSSEHIYLLRCGIQHSGLFDNTFVPHTISDHFLLDSIRWIATSHISSATRAEFLRHTLRGANSSVSLAILRRIRRISADIRRIPPRDPDIFLRRRQRSGVRGDLHRPRTAEDRQSLPGLPGRGRSLRRWAGDDLCRSQRSSRLLDLRIMVLRHLDRFRCYVQHCLYLESMRHITRSLYTHQGSSQVRSDAISIAVAFRKEKQSNHN